jgi:putative restriction endonuclease
LSEGNLDLDAAIAKVEGEHAEALRWFRDRAGQTVSWQEINDHADQGARLVTQAKGIYKPRYTDFALSVRQTLDSPYADKEVVRRDDGSWVYPYFQENADPSQRDREATNRGLMKCMEQGIPVGVLMQTKPKPGVEYHVLGLGTVAEWRDGYFILEGSSDRGELHLKGRGTDAAFDRAVAAVSKLVDFNSNEGDDVREKQIAEVVRRKGQKKFRDALIAAYGGRCVITGCDAIEALEAAHISPYQGDHSHHPQNGLLLRADLHSLFDIGLIGINPTNMKIIISKQLLGTDYERYDGEVVNQPIDQILGPSFDALKEHLSWSGIVAGRTTITPE